MKEASQAIASTGQASTRTFRGSNWLIDVEPYGRSTASRGGLDDRRLKAALKRAVELDLAPQALIDAIKNEIRKNDELR